MNIVDGEIVGTRAARFLDYVREIGEGEYVSRSIMAERMGTTYSSARYNLDMAVREGWLNRVYGYASETQPGWIYARVESMPRLEGF